jgi:coenzyme F420-dependent glucose-6-phosphate dehydrogenase
LTERRWIIKIGYWAAQEQYSLHQLLDFVKEAEKVGFRTTMTSDHFHPWWHDDAYGNFTWIWISAAAAVTRRMQFVTGVTAPVYRYHPAIIAQAFASLDVLYPGRIGLGLGTGEAMNEVPLGSGWPRTAERLEIVKEAIKLIRELWKGEFVDFDRKYFQLKGAKLYTPPLTKIALYLAASGPKSAVVAATLCDGLITYLSPSKSKEVLQVFDATIVEEARDPDSVEKVAEYKVSFSEDYEKAFQSSTFWRATLLPGAFESRMYDPRKLEQKAKREVPDDKIKTSIHITTSIEDCIKPIEEYFASGFTTVHVHSTSPNEILFINEFAKVLSYFGDKITKDNFGAAA